MKKKPNLQVRSIIQSFFCFMIFATMAKDEERITLFVSNWQTPEAIGYNISTVLFIILGLYLGIRGIINGKKSFKKHDLSK